MNLKKQIEEFEPINEQEEKDKDFFLKSIDTFDDVLTRNNEFLHFSSSAFVVNKEHTKMLVVYHNIFDGWVYPGGHADGEDDLLQVAIREVEEETAQKVKVLDKNIYALQACPIQGHVKRGKYVSAHTHLDVVYLLEADENNKLSYREEESKGVKWIPFEEAYGKDMVGFIRPIHKKIIDKINEKFR